MIPIQNIYYIEGNYVIKHNSDKAILHIKGVTSSVNVFPNTAIHVEVLLFDLMMK